MPPKKVGIIAHTGKPGAAELIKAVVKEFDRCGIKTAIEKESAALIGRRTGSTIAKLATETDLLVVLGGDGTILAAADQLGATIKPIFGINIGSLGFLTCVSSEFHRKAVETIAKGKINFSERTLLDISIKGAKSKKAFNDAVFSRGEVSRLIRLRTLVNGESLTEFNADGLIVATPTGSTAYSLSAGGPIMTPESGVFVITPICPHVLTNRSIIVEDSSLIEVEVTERDYPVYLTVDGGVPILLKRGTVVSIRKAKKTLPLAVMPDVSFFGVVRQKLKWSGSNI